MLAGADDGQSDEADEPRHLGSQRERRMTSLRIGTGTFPDQRRSRAYHGLAVRPGKILALPCSLSPLWGRGLG